MRFSDRLMDIAPAKDWNSAYPMGNGSLGVMIDGGVAEETLYMNDDSFWSGGEVSYRSNAVFPEVKRLAMAGDYAQAEELLWRDVYGEYAETYLPLCDIHITRDRSVIGDYSRTLDLTSALHTMNNGDMRERVFVSHPRGVMVVDTRAETAFDSSIRLDTHVRYRAENVIENGVATLALHLQAPAHKDPKGHELEQPIIYDENVGMRAYFACEVVTDGAMTLDGDTLRIVGAKSIRLTCASTTTYRDSDIEQVVRARLKAVHDIAVSELLIEHIADYKALYDRASIELGSERIGADVTTLTALKRHTKHPDMAMLIFNYGRYLMISASREDSYAMNLQGMWNGDFYPSWSSAYTVNINIEMNYQIAESAGLSECHMPLFRQLKVMEKSGRRTAREQLHTAGWCCGHNSDIWGHTNLTGRTSTFNPAQYALCLSGGAWLATHIFTHYEYTGDVDFLREYYYILRGVAEFYLDYVTRDQDTGYLVMCPSSSPENTYSLDGHRYSITKNTTFDTSIARDIFDMVIKSSEILGVDETFSESCRATRDDLYPFKITRRGTLFEWYGDYKETERTHRHVSHLYGMYPSSQITLDGTPDLAHAAHRTIKRRGHHGIGWSLSWKVCLLARLRAGDEAVKTLYQKLKYYDPHKAGLNYGGCYPNLFSAPPMQIDGNFGITAGIIEMLMQSYDEIRILPALPKVWQSGSFSGLRARGGYVVDCTWQGGKVTTVKVTGDGDSVDIWANGRRYTIPLGENVTL